MTTIEIEVAYDTENRYEQQSWMVEVETENEDLG